MVDRSPAVVLGAVVVMIVAIASAGVIALGFLAPERLFDSAVGVGGFFVATLLMVGCAIVANLYDLRGILVGAFGP